MTANRTKPADPLTGIRVLDAATFLAGPFCATTMAEFGAEVIKIEHPGFGDPLRKLGTPVEGGETLWWLNDARNKKAITLDFAKAEGAELIDAIVSEWAGCLQGEIPCGPVNDIADIFADAHFNARNNLPAICRAPIAWLRVWEAEFQLSRRSAPSPTACSPNFGHLSPRRGDFCARSSSCRTNSSWDLLDR